MLIEIIDIGVGNVHSIENLIHKLNIPTKIISSPKEIKSDFLILPGVGSAKSYMNKLHNSGFDKAIKKHVKEKKKLLGICLGFQILGKYSDEDGGVYGLNLIDGYTKRLENNLSNNTWQEFSIKKENLIEQNFIPKLKLTKKQGIKGRVFYNHEYGFICKDKNCFTKSISTKLNQYSSIVVKDNIIGMQFHPEKSQQTGINLMSLIL